MPAGEGVWRVWRVLESLEGLEGLERLRAGKRQLWKPIESHCCGLGPGVPVREVALALGCLLGTVFGGFGRFWRVWRIWKVLAGLERLRAGKRQLWKPIESHCCGLGPGVPVREVALALGCLLGKVFGGFGRFWRVFGGFGGFWRVWRLWRVLEGLERLRAGKRQLWKPIESHCCGLGPGVPVGEVALALGCLLGTVFGGFGGFGKFWNVWSVCGLANGSFESP